jgi:hypothetical protein
VAFLKKKTERREADATMGAGRLNLKWSSLLTTPLPKSLRRMCGLGRHSAPTL